MSRSLQHPSLVPRSDWILPPPDHPVWWERRPERSRSPPPPRAAPGTPPGPPPRTPPDIYIYIDVESYSPILWNIIILHVYIYIRYIHTNLLYQEQLQKLREETARDFTGFDNELMASYGFGISHLRRKHGITRHLNLK